MLKVFKSYESSLNAHINNESTNGIYSNSEELRSKFNS